MSIFFNKIIDKKTFLLEDVYDLRDGKIRNYNIHRTLKAEEN